jgi:hypothetical protein
MNGAHLHTDQLAGTSGELAGDRLRFAGQPIELLTGGSGFSQADSTAVAPPGANGLIAGAISGAPHVGVIGLVLIAAAILIILDRAGFRFAVTAGKR